jgi:transposase
LAKDQQGMTVWWYSPSLLGNFEKRKTSKMSRVPKSSRYDTKEKDSSAPSIYPSTSTSTTSSSSSSSTSGEYVNHGYENWLKVRQEWRFGSPRTPQSAINRRRAADNKDVDVEEILERIFNSSNSHDMTLPEPVSLNKMVEILLDVWEADGLYD